MADQFFENREGFSVKKEKTVRHGGKHGPRTIDQRGEGDFLAPLLSDAGRLKIKRKPKARGSKWVPRREKRSIRDRRNETFVAGGKKRKVGYPLSLNTSCPGSIVSVFGIRPLQMLRRSTMVQEKKKKGIEKGCGRRRRCAKKIGKTGQRT